MTGGPVARVLVDSPLPQLDQLFDYRVPDRLAEAARPGVRVRVPLRSGGRIADGWLVELAASSEYEGRLSDVDDVVSEVPLLTPDVWRLARAAADRAAGNASDILRLAIPSRYVRVERAWRAAEPDAGPLPSEAVAVGGFEPGAVEAGIAAGERLSLAADPRPVRLPNGEWVGAWAVTLAQAAARTLAGDRSSLVIVPDYRDQEQLEAALAAVVDPRRVLRTDARQSGGARFRAFLDATGDAARIIIGNRSTVYAPAARLGLIAMWDDGDALQHEPLSPGVHPRDAALIRQEQSGAALIFLGHTRSVEVERLVEIGWVRHVASHRHTRPRVILTEQQSSPEPGSARIPSTAWRQAQEAVREGPVLVQVARPGHTPMLVCDRCREPARCAACGGGLAVPRSGGVPRCTLCGASAASWTCPVCESTKLRAATVGATRTADELGRAFPRAKVVLSDGERPVLRVGPEPALVVATRGAEPIADGGYRAVLLLDGERMLLRESLRVAEDCLRWWSNAAALAAPGAPVFLVGVAGALAQTLAGWRQLEWAGTELAARRALRFPPAVRVASVTAPHAGVERAITASKAAAPGVDVLGPTPAEEDLERAIVRFDYGAGNAVAKALRAEMITVATERRRPVGGRPPRRPRVLRVRFDDPDVP
ncbi:primosomal protein N' [Agromyces sp. H3Y2-19a]|uniref:primosomal protein N' family DNA-binding protein n=1 Tax=Agromyces TaxID=33877 RepID=UPI001E58E09A|nr:MULTISPECIES: primosomal protein N' [Agromyces]MCD5347045.1 primosomal protein N' [Agromyces sp. S2-1-8]MDF0515234.1 primosomal protein N' [Agromyces chromiiresistens]